MEMNDLYCPAGSLAEPGVSCLITPQVAGWIYSGLAVIDLAAAEARVLATGLNEVAVLPLSGGCIVEVEGRRFDLAGRAGVFEGVTDWAYLPIDAEARITATGQAQIALCAAVSARRIDPYYVEASAVRVEVRGGGVGTRQINNFLSADSHDAGTLIAVEVITPAGNWSSYPPHKHDEFSENEVALEEIYYFRIDGDHGIGMFNLYTANGDLSLTTVVRDQDVVLVPYGFHGPAAAAPGHHMYYLNVMAGPTEERVWKFCDDPAHAWARSYLDSLPPDPRLPLTSAPSGRGPQ
jgi:5-deoxy-glucuronate isomerase